MTWLSVLAPLWRPIAALFGALATYWKGRADARRDAEIRARRAEDAMRKRADEAAREYRNDDVVDRLRRGGF